MENTAEFYYEKLRTADNPGAVLASLYCSLYDISVTKSELILCNRLIKVFGRFTVFFSIIDLAGSYKKVEEPYALLYTICKRKFENAHGESILQSREPLDKMISSIDNEIKKMAKSKSKEKLPSSKGL